MREQTASITRLTGDNNELRQRLAEYNEASAAAHRLHEQLEKKDLLIASLRNDIDSKDKRIDQYEFNLRDLQSTSGTRVEKQLVKSILLSYFHTPVDKRQEVVPLLGALVGFTQDEYHKAIDATSPSHGGRASGVGWLSGWLVGQTPTAAVNSTRARTQSETPVYDPNKVR
jgi:chromosome segregation ATPase